MSRLLRVFRDARDCWRAMALERQKRLRAAQLRIHDLERRRTYWEAEGAALGG